MFLIDHAATTKCLFEKKKKICDIYLPLYTKINFKRIICYIQKLTLKGPYTELQVKIMEIMSLAQRALPGSHSESQRKSSFSRREKGRSNHSEISPWLFVLLSKAFSEKNYFTGP